jgi:lysophospholipase L1-like esterase
LLNALRRNTALRAALGKAQVITLWTGWNDLWPLLARFMLTGELLFAHLDPIVHSLRVNFEAILDEILQLRSPGNAVVRIADGVNPFVAEWLARGWLEKLHEPCFESWRVPLVDAAEARGFKVVPTYHAIHGPNGTEPGGDIFQEDGVHFNLAGHRLLADLHRQAGYAEVISK